VPDARGRTLVTSDSQGGTDAGRLSSDNAVLATGGAERVTLTVATMPYHAHGGLTGVENQAHNHGPGNLAGNTDTPGVHVHDEYNDQAFVGTTGSTPDAYLTFGAPTQLPIETRPTTSQNGSEHGHHVLVTGGVTDPENQQHNHNITAEGGNGAHENMPPFLTVYTIIRL
jgi:microcystin-dependent protein